LRLPTLEATDFYLVPKRCYDASMDSGDFDVVFRALHEAEVRCLVVGGVAVVLHGHPRLTADIDLVVALDEINVTRAMVALGDLGYRPRAPVAIEQFANAEVRRSWIEDKGLTVFSLWSKTHPATEIDVFVKEPFMFDEAFERSVLVSLGATQVRVVSIADLIAMKQLANRPKDLEDIRALRAIEDDQ
jgi:Nucleotidyl transferase AbiEii toxin, Type IV TA system